MKLLKIPPANNNFIVVADIIRVEALSNYSRIHLSDGKKLVAAKVLHWFEDELPIEMFARVHRSHLINKLYVQKINGIHPRTLHLYNGEIITVSKRKKLLLKEQLSLWIN